MSENPNHSHTAPIQVTLNALSRITALSDNDKFIRIAVNGGGCSGFKYAISIDNQLLDGDILIDHEGKTIIAIDKASMPMLYGSVIDFDASLSGGKFAIMNPAAQHKCGCGNSFST